MEGTSRSVSEEALFQLLICWENWKGTSSEFYRSLGFSHRKMAGLIGKANTNRADGGYNDQGHTLPQYLVSGALILFAP